MDCLQARALEKTPNPWLLATSSRRRPFALLPRDSLRGKRPHGDVPGHHRHGRLRRAIAECASGLGDFNCGGDKYINPRCLYMGFQAGQRVNAQEAAGKGTKNSMMRTLHMYQSRSWPFFVWRPMPRSPFWDLFTYNIMYTGGLYSLTLRAPLSFSVSTQDHSRTHLPLSC